MNKFALLAVLVFAFSACNDKQTATSTEMSTEIDSVSYAYGQLMAVQMERSEWPSLNPDMIRQAFVDYNASGDSGMSFETMQANQILMAFDSKTQAKINGDAGAEYLAKNKVNKGVVVLPSGLQYKVISSGDGESPQATDTVMCNYKGHLISGKVFDASDEGEPAKFKVDEVIRGWTEALQLMKTGDKWMLYVPSEMAYGEGGNQVIPPNSSLVFEVELVEIIK